MYMNLFCKCMSHDVICNIKQNINFEGIYDAHDLRNFYLLVYLLTNIYRFFQTEEMLVTYVFFSFYFKPLVELVAA